ncbi:hypothetical protein JW935_26225 [candidate division KSB1 bacterium]|nr:hypothetical protein [candidate division KSB1 bacterium]
MIRQWKYIFAVFISAGIVMCTTPTVRFANNPPVRFYNDIRPIPTPQSVKPDKFEYFATSNTQRPRVKTVAALRGKEAYDINSYDQVPVSSWFIPRLGYENISAQDLINGPFELGPPRPPLTIIRVRNPQTNPRLFIYDSRNIHYLLKMDPPGWPHIATSSSYIVNRFFWGFGYHVPEDHLIKFTMTDFQTETGIDIRDILSRVAAPEDGFYTAIASRILEGLPLGPIPETGVRRDDPNDHFPHEHRRVLRGLYVFCAYTNMSDIGTDNTLDMYVGESGRGYIKHHIIDFDDAFGTSAARHDRLWAGYNHLFSIPDIISNFFTLGLTVEPWEKLDHTPWKSVGSFEAFYFQPDKWKETYPYKPIRLSQPSDRYWAAKTIGALSEEHIKTVVESAGYPETEAEKYIIQTLVERRKKILDTFLRQVSPIEFLQISNNTVTFRDVSRFFIPIHEETNYHARYLSSTNEELLKMTFSSDSCDFSMPVSEKLIKRANGYFSLEIHAQYGQNKMPTAAVFHFRGAEKAPLVLVGVIH